VRLPLFPQEEEGEKRGSGENQVSPPPRSLVRDGQTSPHRPRLVVSRSTCLPLFPLPPREQLCNRYCSNKHTHLPRPSKSAVMARRRRRRPPGGHTTAAGSGARRAPLSTDTASHTHTARSLACPLLTLSSARPFSNGIFRSDGAPASLPPASSSLTHARRMDGFCNQNAFPLYTSATSQDRPF
jgi:hypothetical protein